MRDSGRTRTGTVLGTLATALLLALAGPATASAPPILTEDFDRGDQGWEVYFPDGSERDADWHATGGDPDGFVSYASSGGAIADAGKFVDSSYVAHIARYDDANFAIVATMRTSDPDPTAPIVYLGDPYYPEGPTIHTRAKRPLSTGWTDYRFPIDAGADPGWRDADGDRLGERRFHRFLETDPAIMIAADYAPGADGRTDLDNVGIAATFPRSISIRYRPKLDAFTGTVTVTENPGDDPRARQCVVAEPVRLFRKKPSASSFEQVGSANTNSAGNYSISSKGRPGSYFAFTPQTEQPSGVFCARARSKTLTR